ncbi:MAG TPA: acyl-CoA thioester hydrolase/BAAT C-terminal domain-containing protein [Longimicrobiales bacterium]|nr:acyl-CoA thioester hydrolase/BAAT C-terminal domain-containing protein [Longimicrobiales bacterium]
MLQPIVLAMLVAQNPAIVATPSDALIDERVAITVSGLPPHTQVTLRSYVRADSVTWYAAHGVYVTDARGAVWLGRDASTAGTYTGIDAMGLFWSGRKVDAPTEPWLQSLQRVDPPKAYQMALTVSIGDSTHASTVVTRRFESPDVRSEEVRAGDVVGSLFLPRNPPPAPAVIVLGGSEGGYQSSSYQARLLAAHGFIAFAQAYFRADGLRDELASVPVERVQRAIRFLQARRDVGARSIALIAHSRGTELALLSAGQYPEIRAVIVSGTSATTGSGLTRSGEPHREAAWTLNGQALPVMQWRPPAEALAQFSKPDPVRLRLLFEPALSDARAVRDAAIPVIGIRADVLIISGLDDHMGPADIAGDMLMEWLARSGHQERRTHLKYPEAGHVIGIPYTPTELRLLPWRFSFGGTAAGYARADVDSWTQLLDFLRGVR